MTAKPARTLSGTDTAMGRRVTATGVLVGLIAIGDRVHVTLQLPADAVVEIHPKDST